MSRRVPISTYRLQLNAQFTFADAKKIIPYLKRLGISDLYASPILQARTGSMHGYDVVDPTRINEELGGKAGFDMLARELTQHEMGLLLDIVPNHMAIGPSPPNRAWMDVLVHSRASPFASWFDVAWEAHGETSATESGILIPILGKSLSETIDDGEITIAFEETGFCVRYFEWTFPLDPRSWELLLTAAAQLAKSNQESRLESALLERVATAARDVPDWRKAVDPISRKRRQEKFGKLKEALRSAISEAPGIVHELSEAARQVSLHELLSRQPYTLCHWKEATRQLTYRRFFDITHLIGVRVEEPEVFRATHELILKLVRQGKVTGLRIDHVDGMAEPARYLRELQSALSSRSNGEEFYVLVEKILAGDETLDPRWPVAGTTGYDFLNALSGAFVSRAGLEKLTAYQASLMQHSIDLDQVVCEQKKRIARELFGGEVQALTHQLCAFLRDIHVSNIDYDRMADAIVEVSARLPVYRTYITRENVRNRELRERDRNVLLRTFERAKNRAEENTLEHNWLMRALLMDLSNAHSGDALPALVEFIIKWQQFTGPLAAKGVEDTVLYRDARLVSLNTVGADAAHIESPGGVGRLHSHNLHIAECWPLSMTTTSTHDTKRSEDVRSRLHVLSEIADEWTQAAARWRDMNSPLRTLVDGEESPDSVSELFLYQSMLGAWPLDEADEPEFAHRMEQYAVKAAREAKLRTSWIHPHDAYERAVVSFVRGVLDPAESGEFLRDLKRMYTRISLPGAINALSSTTLKIASPGIPDFYQGTELWDLSLVDPDNRRPVDFSRREQLLAQIESLPAKLDHDVSSELLENWRDGRIKMLITHRGLGVRNRLTQVIRHGEYIPLAASGEWRDHVCAFARRFESSWVITIAPILTEQILDGAGAIVGERVWRQTKVTLPADAPRRWRDAMSGHVRESRNGCIRLADALDRLPVALLTHPF